MNGLRINLEYCWRSPFPFVWPTEGIIQPYYKMKLQLHSKHDRIAKHIPGKNRCVNWFVIGTFKNRQYAPCCSFQWVNGTSNLDLRYSNIYFPVTYCFITSEGAILSVTWQVYKLYWELRFSSNQANRFKKNRKLSKPFKSQTSWTEFEHKTWTSTV